MLHVWIGNFAMTMMVTVGLWQFLVLIVGGKSNLRWYGGASCFFMTILGLLTRLLDAVGGVVSIFVHDSG